MEEVEIQTTIDSKVAQFKIKSAEFSGLFDLGAVQAGEHLLNPYVGVKIPRSAAAVNQFGTTTLGVLFHLARGAESRFRFQSELAFQQEPAKDRTQVDAKAQFNFAYNRFVFSALESFSLTKSSVIDSKLSAAGVYRDLNGYAQLDLTNTSPLVLSLGVGYRPHRKVSVYAQAVQSLVRVEKVAEKVEPVVVNSEKVMVLAAPAMNFGVDYAHCTGFGAKAAIDLKGKLQTALNFSVNKYFSGSLLFDVS